MRLKNSWRLNLEPGLKLVIPYKDKRGIFRKRSVPYGWLYKTDAKNKVIAKKRPTAIEVNNLLVQLGCVLNQVKK